MSDNQRTILVIDDDTAVRESITYFLEDRDYIVISAENGLIGLEISKKENIDLVLSDMRMPEMDGLEFIKHFKKDNPDTPVIIVSGIKGIDDALEALHLGAWDYVTKPIEPMSILQHTIERVFEKADLINENKEYQKNLEEMVLERTKKLAKQNLRLEISQRQMIGILSQAAEYRDFETGSHFLRVSEYSALIAEELGLDRSSVLTIQLASPVHDIGKIGIPDHILLKPTKLDEDEWEGMKDHCEFGSNILKANKFIERFYSIDALKAYDVEDSEELSLINCASNIAMYHHEHWDGSGYPKGLKGTDIPIEARITTVADVFDALSSKRPYKEAWDIDRCIDYIKEKSGTSYDPEVVNAFLARIDKVKEIIKTYDD